MQVVANQMWLYNVFSSRLKTYASHLADFQCDPSATGRTLSAELPWHPAFLALTRFITTYVGSNHVFCGILITSSDFCSSGSADSYWSYITVLVSKFAKYFNHFDDSLSGSRIMDYQLRKCDYALELLSQETGFVQEGSPLWSNTRQ